MPLTCLLPARRIDPTIKEALRYNPDVPFDHLVDAYDVPNGQDTSTRKLA